MKFDEDHQHIETEKVDLLFFRRRDVYNTTLVIPKSTLCFAIAHWRLRNLEDFSISVIWVLIITSLEQVFHMGDFCLQRNYLETTASSPCRLIESAQQLYSSVHLVVLRHYNAHHPEQVSHQNTDQQMHIVAPYLQWSIYFDPLTSLAMCISGCGVFC